MVPARSNIHPITKYILNHSWNRITYNIEKFSSLSGRYILLPFESKHHVLSLCRFLIATIYVHLSIIKIRPRMRVMSGKLLDDTNM